MAKKTTVQGPQSPDELMRLIHSNNSKINENTLGHCMFSGKAIMKQDWHPDPQFSKVGYQLQGIVISIPNEEKNKIFIPFGVLLFLNEEVRDRADRQILISQLSRIDLDYGEIVGRYNKYIKEDEITKKYQQQALEELNKLNENTDGKK